MLNPEANNYQYLFLGGLIGEVLSLPFVGSYLHVNRKILNENGVENVECMTLNSLKSAHDNAKTLAREISVLFAKSHRPLIIFAHSKACLEVMLCMIENPSLFKNKVQKVVCVQPPFQGASVLAEVSLLKFAGKFWPGLRCLESNYYSEKIQKEILQNISLKSYVRDHLLVVRGSKQYTEDVSWIIKYSHRKLKKAGLLSDGLVNHNDQVIPFVDYKEIVLDIDHSDLFTNSLLSKRDDKFRNLIISKIINLLINSEILVPIHTESDQYLFDPDLDKNVHANLA